MKTIKELNETRIQLLKDIIKINERRMVILEKEKKLNLEEIEEMLAVIKLAEKAERK